MKSQMKWKRWIAAVLLGGAVSGAQAKEAPNASIYPVDVCVVSGKKLGSMGDPYIHLHEGREIRFCCSGCVSKFTADPAGHFAKLDKLIMEKQKADYPLKECVVSGEALGSMGTPVDKVYNNRLVRFCCMGCIEDFEADPATYLKKLDAGKAAPVSAVERGHNDPHGHPKH